MTETKLHSILRKFRELLSYTFRNISFRLNTFYTTTLASSLTKGWRLILAVINALILFVHCTKGNVMCCSNEQPLVGSEFVTSPKNGCEGDYFPQANSINFVSIAAYISSFSSSYINKN